MFNKDLKKKKTNKNKMTLAVFFSLAVYNYALFVMRRGKMLYIRYIKINSLLKKKKNL